MKNIRFVTVDQFERSKLERFLEQAYPKAKSEFLCRHGKWWYRGDQNRWVVLSGEEIAAYFGIISTNCLINGNKESAFWWVDLIVNPKFRGQAFQTLIDQEVRLRPEIKLGFPNLSAAKIHRKHGWGLREDLQVMLLPLWPLRVKRIHFTRGLIGFMLRLGAVAITPLAMLNRLRLTHYTPINARVLESASADFLEKIFLKYRKENTITTYRDAEYFKWRYLDAPYRPELVFYISGSNTIPSHFLIVRNIRFQDIMTTRILDIFGEFNDLNGLKDILKLAVKDAIIYGSGQITVLVTLPQLESVFRSIGFQSVARSRFCWFTKSNDIMDSIKKDFCYWSLADSDNDAPE